MQTTKLLQSHNNINFLRLVFASLVIVSHAPELADGNRSRELLSSVFGTTSFGGFAVACFFLLSGFLIVKSWQSRPELKTFFKKRIQRIYPGFVAALLISVVVIAPFGTPNAYRFFAGLNFWELVKDALFLRMPEHVAGAYPGTHYAHVNGALWTIVYEFRCYTAVAVVGTLLPYRQKTAWLSLFILSILFVYMIEPLKQGRFFGLIWLVPPSIAKLTELFIYFASGACFYLFSSNISYRWKWVFFSLPITGLLMFKYFLSKIGLATVGAYSLFSLAFVSIPSLNWFRKMPDLSYGIYLYGWPIQKILFWYFPTVSPWLMLPFTFGLSCIAGYISWELIESPFLRRKRRPDVQLTTSPIP